MLCSRQAHSTLQSHDNLLTFTLLAIRPIHSIHPLRHRQLPETANLNFTKPSTWMYVTLTNSCEGKQADRTAQVYYFYSYGTAAWLGKPSHSTLCSA